MANWECTICHEMGSDFGSYVKGSSKKMHLACYRDRLAQEAVEKYLRDQAEEKQLRERAESDRTKALEESQLQELQILRARSESLWTREDRRQLAAAKLICVHCGVPIGPGAKESRSGPEQKHCQKCYYAREYGEQKAAATAAKSQAGIDGAAAVLAGAQPQATTTKKPEAKDEPKTDRFSLLDLD